MDRDELILVLSEQQWQKCKGELRALCSILGSCKSTTIDSNFMAVSEEVQTFIKKMEEDIL